MRVSASLGSGSWRSALPPASGLIQDISDDAVWSLSSCKGIVFIIHLLFLITIFYSQLLLEGLGVHQLLDDRSDTYWQSDGLQPHTITIEFQRKTDISFIVIYLDYKADESYTPSK
jgi:anaphase-promoting complex subunit 10